MPPGVVVGQRAIPEDTNEVTQVLPLLDTIAGGQRTDDGRADLTGTAFTADALHVHRENIEAPLDRGGEYVLTVKGNQPTLHTALKNLFADADGRFPPSPHHV